MNIFKKFMISAIMAALVLSACACSDGKNDETKTSSGAVDVSESSAVSESSGLSGATASSDSDEGDNTDSSVAASDGETGGKYTGVETYTNEEGNKSAKTESGVEVELTPENFERLMEEYQALQETDPEKAKELLDQLQIFFDNMGALGE